MQRQIRVRKRAIASILLSRTVQEYGCRNDCWKHKFGEVLDLQYNFYKCMIYCSFTSSTYPYNQFAFKK